MAPKAFWGSHAWNVTRWWWFWVGQAAAWAHVTADPWYLQVCGSKKTAIEEKLHVLRRHGLKHCTVDAWFSFPSTQLLPKTGCLSNNLRFSLFHINLAHDAYLPLGAPFLFWEVEFTKWRSGRHLADHTTISTPLMITWYWLRASLLSSELWNACRNLKILVLKFIFIFEMLWVLATLDQNHM